MEKAQIVTPTDRHVARKDERPIDVLPAFTLALWLDGVFPRGKAGERGAELSKIRQQSDDAMVDLRSSLLGASPTPLERLLVDRIVILHAALYFEDHRLALNSSSNHDAALMLHKRVQQLEKRYLGAIRALAEIRRLQLPTMQINVAQQQVVTGSLDGAGTVFSG